MNSENYEEARRLRREYGNGNRKIDSDNLVKSKIFAVVSAVFCLVSMLTYITLKKNVGIEKILWFEVVTCLIYVFLCVCIFIRNQKAVLCISGVWTLYELYRCRNVLGSVNIKDWLYSISILCTYISLIGLLVFAIKKHQIVKKVWFIPGTLCFLTIIINIIIYNDSLSSLLNLTYFKRISDSLSFVFLGLWLKNEKTE